MRAVGAVCRRRVGVGTRGQSILDLLSGCLVVAVTSEAGGSPIVTGGASTSTGQASTGTVGGGTVSGADTSSVGRANTSSVSGAARAKSDTVVVVANR